MKTYSFNLLLGFTNVHASKMFSLDNSSPTRNYGIKLRCKHVELDITKFFSTDNKVRECKLPPSVVQRDTINPLKNKLEHLAQGI